MEHFPLDKKYFKKSEPYLFSPAPTPMVNLHGRTKSGHLDGRVPHWCSHCPQKQGKIFQSFRAAPSAKFIPNVYCLDKDDLISVQAIDVDHLYEMVMEQFLIMGLMPRGFEEPQLALISRVMLENCKAGYDDIVHHYWVIFSAG